MAINNKLKAYVRFDGSGRIVPSSVILQRSKPKVGNWKEININQCCNTPAAPGNYLVDLFYLDGDVCGELVASNISVFTDTPVSIGKWYTFRPNPADVFSVHILGIGDPGGWSVSLIDERNTCSI